MANSHLGPRKQRTRQHVIADLSVHHLEGFILEEGHTAQRFGSDYSYDMNMRTFDGDGFAEPGVVYCQVKASERLHAIGSTYAFDVDIRDYNLWMQEEMPVILELFDVALRKAFWLSVRRYFDEDEAHEPKKGAKTVRVRVPKRQMVNHLAVQTMRRIKGEMRGPNLGVIR